MAKQKVDLPSADSPTGDWSQPVDVKECLQKAKDTIMANLGHSSLQPDEQLGYVSRHVDVKMSREQAVKFKSILRKLEDENKQLKDGTPVNNKRRAVLWLIENA